MTQDTNTITKTILDAGGAVIGYFCDKCEPYIEIEEGMEIIDTEDVSEATCFRCGSLIT